MTATIPDSRTDPPCKCGHPAAAHDAGECWITPTAMVRSSDPCPCPWYEPDLTP